PHRRALPGAVRPEKAECFARIDVEVDRVDGDEIAESLYESARMHERRLHRDVHIGNLAARRGDKKERMRAAVAAGHPATTAAGVEILEEGGSAADAVVAASLASCVAETVMTGLLGGGHAIYWDERRGTAHNLDCFVAIPGLGGERRESELVEL